MPEDSASQEIVKQPSHKEPVQPSSPEPNNPASHSAEAESDQEMKRDVKDIEDRVKRAERWMIGLTFALALFALGTVIVGIFQWSLTREQVHIGLRAYLIEHDAIVDPKPSIRKIPRVSFKIKNTGQTPAQDIQNSFAVQVLDSEPSVPAGPLTPPHDSLGAGEERTISAGRMNPLTADEFNEIMNQDDSPSMQGNVLRIPRPKRLFVWGLIVYKDVFGNVGQTEFCGVYVASQDKFAGCHDHNGIK